VPTARLLCAVVLAHAALAQTVTVKPADARLRERGNLQDSGAWSFWTDGVFGDWLTREQAGPVTLTFHASGKAVDGIGPRVAVQLIPLVGEPRTVATIELTGDGAKDYAVTFDAPAGFFGLQLRHLNREAGGGQPPLLRHLIMMSVRVDGATLADDTLESRRIFGAPPTATGQTILNQPWQVDFDMPSGTWSIVDPTGGRTLFGIRPTFAIGSLPVDLTTYQARRRDEAEVGTEFGPARRVSITYTKPGELAIGYTLLFLTGRTTALAKIDFDNRTGHELVVGSVAPLVIEAANLPGVLADWVVIGDGKRFNEPYETIRPAQTERFASWWYLAAQDPGTKRSILLGSVTNRKGVGRMLLEPRDGTLRMAAYSDYESIVMPADASVEGEWMVLDLGERGTDSLERFGDLIAQAHGINVRRDHPIDPDDRDSLAIQCNWNAYGSAVVKGFPYRHDPKYQQAFQDPEWVKANRAAWQALGLERFGYGGSPNVRGAGSPLARRYGQPDFWSPQVEQLAKDHPDWYQAGKIDFSNPAVIAYEQERVAKGFSDPTKIHTYAWDFADRWEKLPGQYDPFQTSAQTYRNAMGLWRKAAKRHPRGGWAMVWMNVVGFGYDLTDVIHIGADSDQGYYGPGCCTFITGLVRQISGRYFTNGRVWWNNPDSFHVYCGGLYSAKQAKVHASFCSLSGNLVHLGEPFIDEELPPDRLDIIKRVSPTTMDVSQAVDVFEHNPARLWNMPIVRDFGRWHVVGLFNVDDDQQGQPITQTIRLADLGLDPAREYLVYEFWSNQFLGAVRGQFTRALAAPDCEVYSLVERQDHPQLLSTSRHVRQMALDIRDLQWDPAAKVLHGVSQMVAEDPYELRVWCQGWTPKQVTVEGLAAEMVREESLLKVRFTSPAAGLVAWRVEFE